MLYLADGIGPAVSVSVPEAAALAAAFRSETYNGGGWLDGADVAAAVLGHVKRLTEGHDVSCRPEDFADDWLCWDGWAGWCSSVLARLGRMPGWAVADNGSVRWEREGLPVVDGRRMKGAV